MKNLGESWTQIGSNVAGLMFVFATLKQYFPYQLQLTLQEFFVAFLQQFPFIQKLGYRLTTFFSSPYVQINFPEYHDRRYNYAYPSIEAYLGDLQINKAAKLRGTRFKQSKSLHLASEDKKIWDEFEGVKVWWTSSQIKDEVKFYQLTIHRSQRNRVINGSGSGSSYLDHVMQQGKSIKAKIKKKRLYANNPSDKWWNYIGNLWSEIAFDNPSTFQTLAMDPAKKTEIIDDLTKFKDGKEYYSKIGRAWKRGYLLFGPPGTGKSSLIAAIANFLNYDIYDLELTTIKSNSELRKLIVETSNKCVIVIEDIDCSLDLTGKRKKPKTEIEDEEEEVDDEKKKKVTLSGLLNSIDGIWSACGQERIIIFTTNHVDKLDPALIRRGRMDMHIELSYCRFEGFKTLAKNYLDIESHGLFEKIGTLLKEVDMSPADVAEFLMLKTDADSALEGMVEALEIKKKDSVSVEKPEPKPKTKLEWLKTKTKFEWLKKNRDLMSKYLRIKR